MLSPLTAVNVTLQLGALLYCRSCGPLQIHQFKVHKDRGCTLHQRDGRVGGSSEALWHVATGPR
jgi:hypothetical protein